MKYVYQALEATNDNARLIKDTIYFLLAFSCMNISPWHRIARALSPQSGDVMGVSSR
jgi:hypothetical protein